MDNGPFTDLPFLQNLICHRYVKLTESSPHWTPKGKPKDARLANLHVLGVEVMACLPILDIPNLSSDEEKT